MDVSSTTSQIPRHDSPTDQVLTSASRNGEVSTREPRAEMPCQQLARDCRELHIVASSKLWSDTDIRKGLQPVHWSRHEERLVKSTFTATLPRACSYFVFPPCSIDTIVILRDGDMSAATIPRLVNFTTKSTSEYVKPGGTNAYNGRHFSLCCQSNDGSIYSSRDLISSPVRVEVPTTVLHEPMFNIPSVRVVNENLGFRERFKI